MLQIPDMLGVVLSSSKYGVRQARGKYGMGAKMALIWSKKSTGLPIQVKTLADLRFTLLCLFIFCDSSMHLADLKPDILGLPSAGILVASLILLASFLSPNLPFGAFLGFLGQVISGCSHDQNVAPGFLSKCVLDIDIYKNRPSVHEHLKLPNEEVSD